MTFTDGLRVGAALDRNGSEPFRYIAHPRRDASSGPARRRPGPGRVRYHRKRHAETGADASHRSLGQGRAHQGSRDQIAHLPRKALSAMAREKPNRTAGALFGGRRGRGRHRFVPAGRLFPLRRGYSPEPQTHAAQRQEAISAMDAQAAGRASPKPVSFCTRTSASSSPR